MPDVSCVECRPRPWRPSRRVPWLLLSLVLWCATVPVLAEELAVQASVDHSQIALDGTIRLGITIMGTQQVEAPALTIDGFSVRYLGPSTSISVVNGAVSSSVTHMYVLLPQREGRFTIGPIEVRAVGKVLHTQPITVSVARTAGTPIASGDTQVEAARPIRLQIAVDKSKAYVNERIPARVQLLVGQRGVRGIEMPSLKGDGFLVKPFGQPTQSDVVINGESWTLLEFDTEIVPIRAGALTLGPATLDCQVVVRRAPARRRAGWSQDPFDRFFGQDSPFDEFFGIGSLEPVTVTAEPVTVEVKPLPEEGKPADFAGAVGQFSLDVKAVPTQVAVGEPVTLTMTISGTGNFDTVTPPVASCDPKQFKVYEPKLQQAPGGDQRADRKVFEQVLIPLQEQVTQVPELRFSYFDPAAGRYVTVRQGPMPITVTPAARQEPMRVVEQAPAASGAAAPIAEPLGQDILFIKERLGPRRVERPRWYADGLWLWCQLSPLLLLGLGVWWRRRQQLLENNPAAMRASGAMSRALGQLEAARRLSERGQSREFCEEISRTLQRYVRDRFNLSSGALTRVELERDLRPLGVPDDLLRDLLEVFERCEAARFAPSSSSSSQEMAQTLAMTDSVLRRLD